MSRILSDTHKNHRQRSYTWYRKGTGSDISFWDRMRFTSHDSFTSLTDLFVSFLQLLCIPNELSDILLLQLISLNRLQVLSYHILQLRDQQQYLIGFTIIVSVLFRFRVTFVSYYVFAARFLFNPSYIF